MRPAEPGTPEITHQRRYRAAARAYSHGLRLTIRPPRRKRLHCVPWVDGVRRISPLLPRESYRRKRTAQYVGADADAGNLAFKCCGGSHDRGALECECLQAIIVLNGT